MSFSAALQLFLSDEMSDSDVIRCLKTHNISLNEAFEITDQMIDSGIWCSGHSLPRAIIVNNYKQQWRIEISDKIELNIVYPKTDVLLSSYESGRKKLFQLLSDMIGIAELDLALTIELGETALLFRKGILRLNPICVRQKDAQWLSHTYEWSDDL